MTIPVRLDWQTITGLSRTTLTTHLWTAPPLRRDSPIHDKAFRALRKLNADLVRLLPWFSHPRVSVPELHPPAETETFWDFELLDPYVEDFMAAAKGRPVVANFATIPAWMFTTAVKIPDDPDEIVWEYEQGTELRDPTCAEVAEYIYRSPAGTTSADSPTNSAAGTGPATTTDSTTGKCCVNRTFAACRRMSTPGCTTPWSIGFAPTDEVHRVVGNHHVSTAGVLLELPRSCEPRRRHPARRILLPLLRHARNRQPVLAARQSATRPLARHLLRPGRRFSRPGARKLLIINKTADPVEVTLETDSDPTTIDGYATSVVPRAISAARSALASS